MSGMQRSPWLRAGAEMMGRLAGGAFHATSGSLHVRHRANTDRLLAMFVLASLPAALVGAWGVGSEVLNALTPEMELPGGWRVQALAALGMNASPDRFVAALVLGLMFIVPLMLVATTVSVLWEIVFATVRERAVDPGWPMTSCLFVLLLPHDTPLLLAAIGMTFGTVLGKHIFGGTGRYIASPAVIGALFLHFSYPALSSATSTWQTVASLGSAAAIEQGISWWQVFWGNEVGMLGTSSALACAAGALWLAVTGVVSWRTLFGALLGLTGAVTIASLFGETLPAHWHFALGSFAFCWAFVLTDPTTLPLTRAGRWLHGALFGVLVIIMREADPTHPESTLFAVLLASLFVPLIDYIVLRAQHTRCGGRLEIET